MNIPVIEGIIDRRILINYIVDRDVVQKTLPPPFRPKIYNNKAIAGICLKASMIFGRKYLLKGIEAR